MNDEELDLLLDEWEAPAPPPSLRAGLRSRLPVRRRRRIRERWLVAALLAAATVAVGATIFIRQPVIGSSWAGLADGTHVRTRTLVEPKIAILKWYTLGGGSRTGGFHSFHWFWCRSSRTYSGYEAVFEPLGDRRYRVTVAQLTHSLAELSLPAEAWDYRKVALPTLPAPRIIGEREPFEVDLVRTPDGRERVYDRIELSSTSFEDAPGWQVRPEGADAQMMLGWAHPKLYINGKIVAEDDGAARGPTLWFYVPGRGRWLLGLDRNGNNRFVDAGHVSGNAIRFTFGGEEFRIVANEPIAAGSERRLFVLHQPEFRLNREVVTFGSAGPASMH